MAVLAWAVARLTRGADDARGAHLMNTLRQIASGSIIRWTWNGTKHALKYRDVRYEDARPILDVLELLEQPVTDETRSKLARLLRAPREEGR
jgi:hypothetical protein